MTEERFYELLEKLGKGRFTTKQGCIRYAKNDTICPIEFVYLKHKKKGMKNLVDRHHPSAMRARSAGMSLGLPSLFIDQVINSADFQSGLVRNKLKEVTGVTE